uniref:Coatomer subunit gamma n=1 Tax=Ciona savignyi TaxID=51511 RepID=H2YIY7_CIOSA
SVSSAALVSSLHLTKQAFDVVKRWVNEVQESCSNDSIMVQVSISTNLPCAPHMVPYHALGLLYHLRKKDRLATSKMVTKFMKSGMKSPFAYCMLIRIASKLLEEDDSGRDSPLFNFIESCLRNKHELVIYEAASAIVNMPNCSARELAPAVSVLQQFISSAQPSMRFAGVKTLSKVAMKHPSAVTACNLDLENLITDVNRSIATLAITTLLKTGSESSVDRLMKQISSFMSEISDEFKVVVVRAISALCQKYPRQHSVMMSYLASMLRAEGGFEYKKAIVECIISILEDSAESKESGLAHLCEFIEEEFILEGEVLATKIIHLLGREGPKTPNPSKYIRFIYNRVILENEAVRAAAVSALARFGAQCDDLRESILSLLSRSMMDEDDEVRDRATFYFHTLQQQQKALNSAYILNGLAVSVPALERCLQQYLLEPSDEKFNLKSVPLMAIPDSEPKLDSVLTSRKAKEQPTASKQEIYAGNPPVVCHIRMVVNPIPPTSPHFTSSPPPEQLSRIPEFGVLGNLFKSSDAVELTESETEYVVKCTKHTFPHHLVLQFDCTNTLNDQVLEDVTVQVEQSDAFEVIAYVPCPSLPYNQPGVAYACVAIPEGDEVTTTLSCVMKFRVKDCDPNTGEADDDGYDDEYVLEDLDIVVADHVQKVIKSNFGSSWDELGDGNELEDTYALSSLNTLQDAVRDIIKYLGMQACERSDKVPDGKSSHSLFLAGVYRGGHDVLARAKLVLKDGVTMQLTVRSSDAEAARVVTSAVA